MARKRPTKQARESAQREALKQRVRDWVYGAAGLVSDDEPWWAELIESVMRAIFASFDIERDHFIFRYWNVSNYGSINSTADFLFDRGFRADGTAPAVEE